MQKPTRIAEISTKGTRAYFLLDHPVYLQYIKKLHGTLTIAWLEQYSKIMHYNLC